MQTPDSWLAERASGAPSWMVDEDAMTALSIAVTILVTIGILVYVAVDMDSAFDAWALLGMAVVSPVVFLLAWIPTAVVMFVVAVVAVIGLEVAGALRGARQRRMWEDHLAYLAWAEQVRADREP